MTAHISLGDRMKVYEAQCTERRAIKGLPLILRLDGSSFSRITKGLERPFDLDFANLMIETMKAVVDQYNPDLGETHSDEISFVWYSSVNDVADLVFGGRFHKIETEIAAWTSVKFNDLLRKSVHADRANRLPFFDARAFNVPTKTEAANYFLWRQLDCTRNAVSTAAQAKFSHKSLQGASSIQMRNALNEIGVEFEDYPGLFKNGTFAQRVHEMRELTTEELTKIPAKHRPIGPVRRSSIKTSSFSLREEGLHKYPSINIPA